MKKFLILALLLMLLIPSILAAPDVYKMFKGQQMVPGGGYLWFPDNYKVYFGTDKDGYIEYDADGTATVNIHGMSTLLEGAGVSIDSGEDLVFEGGDSIADFHLGSGIFKTTTGAVTIGPGAVGLTGSMTIAATKDIIAASTGSDFDFSLSTDGIFKTPGGAVTIGPGAIAVSGSPTVATGKTLAVVDADKLTVGGIIVPQYWDFNVPISATTVDTNIFIPTSNWQVVAVSEVHSVAGNDVGAVTAIVRKTNSTGAPSAGVAVTAGTFDLKGTANTIQSGVVRSGADEWTAKVNATERLTLDVTGTLTTLAGGVVTVRLKRI